ncbi:hypothetical protein ACOME3_003869 [Neoechinorhynchus agilis]
MLNITSKIIHGMVFKDCTSDHLDKLLNKYTKIYLITIGENKSFLVVDPISHSWMDNETYAYNCRSMVIDPISSGLRPAPIVYFKLGTDRTETLPYIGLTFSQIRQIGFQFGRLMQSVCCRATRTNKLFGPADMEFQLVRIVPYFFKYFLSLPKNLAELSSNKISLQHAQRLFKHHNHLSSFGALDDLYLASYGITLHSKKKDCIDVANSMWTSFHALPQIPKDYFPCQLYELFTDEAVGQKAANFHSMYLAGVLLKNADRNNCFDLIRRMLIRSPYQQPRKYADEIVQLGTVGMNNSRSLIGNLEEKYDNLKAEKNEIKSDHDMLKRQLLGKDTEIMVLRHQISKLKRDHETALQHCEEQNRSSVENARKENEDRFNDLMKDKEDLEQCIAKNERMKYEMEKRMSDLKFKLNTAEGRLIEIEKCIGLESGEKSLADLKAEMDNSSGTIKRLNDELASAEKMFALRDSNLRGEVELARERVKELNLSNEELRHKCMNLENKMFKLQSSAKISIEKNCLVDDLRAQLLHERELNAKIETENERLMSDCKYLRVRNEALLTESKKIENRISKWELDLAERERHIDIREQHIKMIQSMKNDDTIPTSQYDEVMQEYTFLKERIKAFADFIRIIPASYDKGINVEKELGDVEDKLKNVNALFGSISFN